jgi:hypothetical protein
LDTSVLAWNEPPNQTGGKVTFCPESVKRIKQPWLWVLWVTDGYIHLFQPLLFTFVRLLLTFKNRARTAVALRDGKPNICTLELARIFLFLLLVGKYSLLLPILVGKYSLLLQILAGKE